ncbi:CHAD domain-containing protein [Rhodopila sp.]|uniref:CYTH and CHAD domain-containing protein n=1 Tax=Rhodopila sp. TaxID=2480087 RepID=UPI003D14C583
MKLLVPEASLDHLFGHARFGVDGAARPEPRRQVTTYFDTTDRALSRRDISLRVRRSGERLVQTLKADKKAGLIADRAEWEWAIEHDTPDLLLLAATPVAAQLPVRPELAPMVVTEIERSIRLLTLDGDVVVEAAIDIGVIIAGGKREPVRELELELRSGDPAALYRLARELHAAVPMTIESQSKATRGYRLLTGEPPAARKAEAIELAAGVTGAAALRRMLHATMGHLLANQPAALAGDAWGVHQMRIAIRRLRAALTLFQPLLDPAAVSRFQAELGRIGQRFGEARDWNVFSLRTLPWMSRVDAQEGGAAGELLRQPAMTRREAAHRGFAQAVQAADFTGLLLDLAAWAEQPDLLGEAASRQPIEALCPALLDRLANKVERLGRNAAQGSDAQRHALRKAMKKLCYGIDCLRGVLSAEAVGWYLLTCKRLLRNLGDSNDTVTAMHLAGHLEADSPPKHATASAAPSGMASDGAASSGLAAAIGLLARRLQRRRAEALQEFAKRWNAFQAAPRIWAPGNWVPGSWAPGSLASGSWAPGGGRAIGTGSLPAGGPPGPTA